MIGYFSIDDGRFRAQIDTTTAMSDHGEMKLQVTYFHWSAASGREVSLCFLMPASFTLVVNKDTIQA